MADLIYETAKQDYDFSQIATAPLRAILTSGYVPNSGIDAFVSDIAPASVIAITSADMTGVSWILGVLDADDTTFGVVAAGDLCDYLIIVDYTGVDVTSRLLAALDSINGLPLLTTGGSINVQWALGGIFGL